MEIAIQPELEFRAGAVVPWTHNDTSLWFDFSHDSQMIKSLSAGHGVLVDTMTLAWMSHGSVEIAPHDVWLQAMMTYGAMVNTNPFAFYPSQKGKPKRTLELKDAASPEAFFASMRDQIDAREFRTHVPEMSTATELYSTLFALASMNSYKQYHHYNWPVTCGIRTVRMAGTKEDWLNVISGLDAYRHEEVPVTDDTVTYWRGGEESSEVKYVHHWNRYVDAVQMLLRAMMDPETPNHWWRNFFHYEDCIQCSFMCGAAACPRVPVPRGHVMVLMYGSSRFTVPFTMGGEAMVVQAGFFATAVVNGTYFVPTAGYRADTLKNFKSFEAPTIDFDQMKQQFMFDTMARLTCLADGSRLWTYKRSKPPTPETRLVPADKPAPQPGYPFQLEAKWDVLKHKDHILDKAKPETVLTGTPIPSADMQRIFREADEKDVRPATGKNTISVGATTFPDKDDFDYLVWETPDMAVVDPGTAFINRANEEMEQRARKEDDDWRVQMDRVDGAVFATKVAEGYFECGPDGCESNSMFDEGGERVGGFGGDMDAMRRLVEEMEEKEVQMGRVDTADFVTKVAGGYLECGKDGCESKSIYDDGEPRTMIAGPSAFDSYLGAMIEEMEEKEVTL